MVLHQNSHRQVRSDFGNNDFHEEPVSGVPEDNIDDVRRMMEDHNDDFVKAEQTRNEGKE
jgi:hypothetical protein